MLKVSIAKLTNKGAFQARKAHYAPDCHLQNQAADPPKYQDF
jgi:hypothetical protein